MNIVRVKEGFPILNSRQIISCEKTQRRNNLSLDLRIRLTARTIVSEHQNFISMPSRSGFIALAIRNLIRRYAVIIAATGTTVVTSVCLAVMSDEITAIKSAKSNICAGE